ncbi:MAG: outer membrane protein assembly factor BamD [Myxococcaceae bacterium]|nr:outer membrane protein assembly factor BamD [Myxococcaceae bacterium]
MTPLREKNDAMGTLLDRAKQGGELPRPGAKERVWQQLQAGPRRTRPAWWLVPIAAAAAVAAFVVFRPVAPVTNEPFATLTLASGDVQSSDGSTWAAARVGQTLPDGAQLKVADKSRAYTRLRGAGALFREGTAASLTTQQLDLKSGAIVAAAAKNLRARAVGYAIDVQAAVFQLEAAADVVTLQVAEGEAHVTGPDTNVVVHAGESWSNKTGKGAAHIAPADAATARALAAAASDEAVLRIAKPVGAQVSLDGVELGTTPLEVIVKRGPHELGAVQGSLRSTFKTTVGGNTTVEVPEAKPLPLPDVSFEPDEPVAVPDPKPLKVDPPADPSQRYMLARSLAQKGRYADAIGIYDGLAKGSSGWAEPAQYEVARLTLRALKKPGDAARELDEYQRRWPQGSLSHEVALSSIEVQLKLGAGPAALRAMDDFLAKFPSSERRGEVHFLRATVRRDRGDCAGAAADYLELLADPVHADDALYFAAVCEQQLGQEGDARRHLTEYLQKFPEGAHAADVRRFFEGGRLSGNSSAP